MRFYIPAHFFNNVDKKCIKMNTQEIYKAVKGYEGLYEISDLGILKRPEKTIKHYRGGVSVLPNKILNPSINTQGYLHATLHKNGIQKTREIHQLVAEVFHNHTPCGYKKVINHINFNILDNRAVNLEIVTARENGNQKHLKSSSKYTGVSWNTQKQKWVSQIEINRKGKYLGQFNNEIEASNAYQKELLKLK